MIANILPLTAANLAETMRWLHGVGIAGCVDLIMGLDHIQFPSLRIIRIPHFMQEPGIRVLGRIVNLELVDDRASRRKHWSINISNMDVP